MKHHEGSFNGGGGSRLYYQSWHPEGSAKAALVIVHGLGEHSGRYPNLVDVLVPAGYAVYGFDNRGHGKSAVKLCAHVMSWSEYLDDTAAFMQLARRQEPELPLFLYGHSMGGLIALGYAEGNPEGLKGVIASAPSVGAVDASPLLLLIGRILSRIAPAFSLDSGLDATTLSREPAVVAAYQNDPLVTGKVSARFSTEFTAAIDRARAGASSFSLPLLMIHGEADRLVPIAGTHEYFQKVPQSDKKLIVYPDGFHEPHNDLQHQQVAADIVAWLGPSTAAAGM